MHYPSPEEVLNSLGLSRLPPQNTTMAWVTPLAIFGAGLVAGVAGAVLLTPKTGREVRHDLRDAATQAGHSIKDAATWAGDHAMAALPHGKAVSDAPEQLVENHAPTTKARDAAATVAK